jgi:plastocyanin
MYRLLICCLVLTFLVGCGSSSGQRPAAETVRVVANDFSFSPAALTLKAGQPIRLALKNDGQVLHDITIVAGPGITAASADMAITLTSKPITMLRPSLAGSDDRAELADRNVFIYLLGSGHEELGMKGTIIVQ